MNFDSKVEENIGISNDIDSFAHSHAYLLKVRTV